MRIDVLTLFPEMFSGPLDASIIKRARDSGLLDIRLTQIRDYAAGKHKVTDDYPYGGGSGMVMKPEPVYAALDAVTKDSEFKPWVVLMTPQGEVFNQSIAECLSRKEWFVIICGHYEGVDERIRYAVDQELSIGDYVLTGGELAAMVVIDAVCRLVPGVLGDRESAAGDSFANGLLEGPQYTRPREFRGMRVPDVLLSGDHEKVRRWRRKESLRRTLLRRRDLLACCQLTAEDVGLLEEIESEIKQGMEG